MNGTWMSSFVEQVVESADTGNDDEEFTKPFYVVMFHYGHMFMFIYMYDIHTNIRSGFPGI
jgi:hypothetical protein